MMLYGYGFTMIRGIASILCAVLMMSAGAHALSDQLILPSDHHELATSVLSETSHPVSEHSESAFGTESPAGHPAMFDHSDDLSDCCGAVCIAISALPLLSTAQVSFDVRVRFSTGTPQYQQRPLLQPPIV